MLFYISLQLFFIRKSPPTLLSVFLSLSLVLFLYIKFLFFLIFIFLYFPIFFHAIIFCLLLCQISFALLHLPLLLHPSLLPHPSSHPLPRRHVVFSLTSILFLLCVTPHPLPVSQMSFSGSPPYSPFSHIFPPFNSTPFTPHPLLSRTHCLLHLSIPPPS